MASSTRTGEDGVEQEIRLTKEDGWWVARDVEMEVTSPEETRTEALENLDDAVALREGEIGREPTEEELRELGIDPAENVTGDDEPPDVLDR